MEDIIYIGVYKDRWSKVYYQDKHYEIYNMSVNKLLKYLNNQNSPVKIFNSSYHSPIRIKNTLFSPTANIKQSDCEYFNLLKVEDRDYYYNQFLANRNLLEKAKHRFIEYKTRQIFE